jgi:hypothetical protein
MSALFCQKDREPSAPGAAIKHRINPVQIFQQFSLNMVLNGI